jgi:hypothetical protein
MEVLSVEKFLIVLWIGIRTKNNIKFPLLLQHFEGWVIKTEKENFDP